MQYIIRTICNSETNHWAGWLEDLAPTIYPKLSMTIQAPAHNTFVPQKSTSVSHSSSNILCVIACPWAKESIRHFHLIYLGWQDTNCCSDWTVRESQGKHGPWLKFTRVGLVWSILLPMPSWPWVFSPQHMIPPSFSRAQEWELPTEIATAIEVGPVTQGEWWVLFCLKTLQDLLYYERSLSPT